MRVPGSEKWGMSLFGTQTEVTGEINCLLLARMLRKIGMGGQLCVRQSTDGPPIAGEPGEPAVYPADQICRAPDLAPEQLLADAKHRTSVCALASRSPREKELRKEAMEQTEKGRLDGPFPSDTEGRPLTRGGPQMVTSAPDSDRLRRIN